MPLKVLYRILHSCDLEAEVAYSRVIFPDFSSIFYNTVFIFRDFNVMIEPEKRGRLNIGMN